MALIPSPDHPIHQMTNSSFAKLIRETMFSAIGRAEIGGQRSPEGHLEHSHPTRLRGGKRVTVERDPTPPNDAFGPPISMVPGLIERYSLKERSNRGLKPSFTGGFTGAFGDIHLLLIGMGAAYGRVIETNELGNDAEQKARISDLLAKWSDHKSHEARKADHEKYMAASDDDESTRYPQMLADELAALKKVPIKLKIDGKTQVIEFDNVRIGLHDAPLAHVLVATGFNAKSLGSRPLHEKKFIISAVSNFDNILVTTDMVADHLEKELAKKLARSGKSANPDEARILAHQILKDSGLHFDSQRAERALLAHVPLIKLMDVIAPLIHAEGTHHTTQPLLDTVGETVPKHPPIHNAEHGARLIEALLENATTIKDRMQWLNPSPDKDPERAKLNPDAIRKHVRKSAMQRPFDVAALTDNPDVQKLLAYQRQQAESNAHLDDVKRALETLDIAIAKQHELGKKTDAVKRATTYEAGTVRRTLGKIMRRPVDERPVGSLHSALASGMGPDELDRIVSEVVAAFTTGSPEPQKNFSEMVRERMEANAQLARKDIPPLP